jgi:hypothetical protein
MNNLNTQLNIQKNQQQQQQQQQPQQSQPQYVTVKQPQAQSGVVKTNIHDLIKSVQMRIRVCIIHI